MVSGMLPINQTQYNPEQEILFGHSRITVNLIVRLIKNRYDFNDGISFSLIGLAFKRESEA